MKRRWQAFLAGHWRNRSAHERSILLLLSLFMCPVLFFFLLWQPAHRAVNRLHDTLPAMQVQSAKLQAQAQEIAKLRHLPPLAALDASALHSAIEASALRHRLDSSICRLEAHGTGAVRITCDAISFAAWLAWLRELQQEQHIRTDSISVSALAQPGMVKITASLTNGS